MSKRSHLRFPAELALICLVTLFARPCAGDPLALPGQIREPSLDRLTYSLADPRLPPAMDGWHPTSLAALLEEASRDEEGLDPGKPVVAPRRPLVTQDELRGFLLGTALLLATDRTTVSWFDPDIKDSGRSGDEAGRSVSRLGTGVPIAIAIALPAALDGRYGRRTSALTAVALLNATILTEGLKLLTGRERPSQSGGRLRFHGPSTRFSSFPSGHTSAAFTVATVLGARYRKLRVPLYILAAAVGWARINAARHFPSDVFVGAAVGIYSGRYVLRHGARLWSIRF